MPATKTRKKFISYTLPDGTEIRPKRLLSFRAVVIVKSIRDDGSYVWQPPEFSNSQREAQNRFKAAIRDLTKVMPSPLCKAKEATVYLFALDPEIEEMQHHLGPVERVAQEMA